MGLMYGSAVISECGLYRYELIRRWESGTGTCVFIMLNPSTADANVDDPTIRRCIGYALSWGYKELVVVNSYAFRATKPKDLFRAEDPIGPENKKYLFKWYHKGDIVVAAWGSKIKTDRQKALFSNMAHKLKAIRLTKDNFPGHPLYLPKDLKPFPIPIDILFP